MAGQCNATLDCSFDYDNLGCDGNTLFFCFNIWNAVLWIIEEKSYINFSFKIFSSNTKEEPSPCDFDITSLNYCDSARECPCGLKHCHHLHSAFFAGYQKKGVCTPPIKGCTTDDDCAAVGDVHTMGKVGVRCKNNLVTNKKECHYSGGIIIA